MIAQCSERCACTPSASAAEAIGSTMITRITPSAAPDGPLAVATSQMGQSTWTRSLISRMKQGTPQPCFRAIDCTP